MEELTGILLSLLLGDGWPEVTGGIWAVCEVPEALGAQGQVWEWMWQQRVGWGPSRGRRHPRLASPSQ